jgi:hypothetical protein
MAAPTVRVSRRVPGPRSKTAVKFGTRAADDWLREVLDPMSPHPEQHSHHVRRVVLPSGKTIEVVYFEDQVHTAPTAGLPAIPPLSHEATDLHVCGRCESQLVLPVEWEEAGTTHWEVTLRCPNCEWSGTGVYEQDVVERFDEELDRGTECLVRDLKRLMTANMEEEIERFIDALENDHLLPEDF